MAKIPTGNYGFATPQAGGLTPTARVDTSVNDATARLGQTLTGIGGSFLEEQKRENQIAADRAVQVQTLTAHANIQNGLAENFDAVQRDLLEGKTDKLAAEATWKESSQKVIQDNLKGVPADRQQLVAAQVKGLEGQLQGKLYDTFRKRDQQEVSAGLVTYGEQMQRFAGTDPQAAIKQYHTFVEGVTYNQFRGAAQGAMQSGSVEALDQVQQRLAGKEGDPLDPAKRNALDQTIFGWKQSIEAKQARAADKAERDATKRFNAATDELNTARGLVLNGAALSPDYIGTLVEKTAGTELAPQVKELLEVQKSASGFANQPPAQRAAVLEEARARRGDPTKGFDPQDERQLKAAEQIDESLRKQVDENPWAAAQRVGVLNSAPAMNISNPQQALQVFQQRTAEIGAVEAWAGKKISPLQPAEADQLTKMVKTLKPDQASTLLAQVGEMLQDPDRIAAVAKQIGDKDGTLGMAMAYSSAKTTEGRYTAELILDGAQRIKDKTIKVDGAVETGWKGAIAKEIRGAYSNQEVESNIIEAAFKIAAATDGDVSRAIRLATGGGIFERNGGKIPLPYGMPERDFVKRLESFTPADLAGQAPGGFVQAGPARLPLADFVKTIPDARLVHAGQGLYNVRAGNTLVTNERGQRITLKVGP